jgi:hypothetical protein
VEIRVQTWYTHEKPSGPLHLESEMIQNLILLQIHMYRVFLGPWLFPQKQKTICRKSCMVGWLICKLIKTVHKKRVQPCRESERWRKEYSLRFYIDICFMCFCCISENNGKTHSSCWLALCHTSGKNDKTRSWCWSVLKWCGAIVSHDTNTSGIQS